ncbi:MAG: tripartite tricarboxylate transporter permease, partial [Deltaproteobacteria bacterium]|nr:tripartite tricarboxylate transporter permease [Deltaproteobacteria bacterium]
LGGVMGLVLLLPFTYGMDSVPAFALLLGMFAVTSTSDTVTSVMLGIPGTAASQATILDGYPLAQKGQAGRAFGAAFTVSAMGGVLGAVLLALSIEGARGLVGLLHAWVNFGERESGWAIRAGSMSFSGLAPLTRMKIGGIRWVGLDACLHSFLTGGGDFGCGIDRVGSGGAGGCAWFW